MNQEDFQSAAADPAGDAFPLTRRSVIEAVRSIDAEERSVPWKRCAQVLEARV